MSNIAFSGLATGLDTGSIVSQLVELRRAPMYRIQARKQGYQTQISALTIMKTKLTAMQNAMNELDSASEFSSLTASTSDENFMTVSAGSDAAAGSYQIKIRELAKSQKSISQGYDDLNASMGTGIVSFNINGETTDLNLTGYTSLEGLKNQINNDVDGITATIINDGSESGNYRLVLSSEEEGSDNSFTMDVSGLSGGSTPLVTTPQPASDATIEIDGTTVTMGSNSSDEVISGLTINLAQITEFDEDDPSADQVITVNVAVDGDGIAEKVKSFVDTYNDLYAYIEAEGAQDGDLYGNPTLRSVASRIENISSSSLDGGLGSITSFYQVGISRGDGRSLDWDEDKFTEALEDDFNGVRDLFVQREGNLGKAYLFDQAIENMTDSIDGLFKISTDALNTKIDYADQSIDRYERSIASYQLTMERKFTAMEMMVSQLQSQGSALYSSN